MDVSIDEDTPSATTLVAVSDQSMTHGTVSVANQIHECSQLSARRPNPSSINERAPIADSGLPPADPSLSVEAGKVDDLMPKMGYGGSLFEQGKMTVEAEVVEDVKDEVLAEGTEAVGGVLEDEGPSDVPAAVIGESLLSEMPGREEGRVMLVETPLEAVYGAVVEQTIEEGDGHVTSVTKKDGMDKETEQMQAGMDVSSTLGRPEKGEAAKIEM